ncbi:hypothetical protein HMPREF9056_00255 [Actinomyces sp. oral taxon 170 str. F0386]|nr:hypothetical protein HMPREF9056_00255 [Actinomyces sp. oral taxon 170 str. F0386]
MATTKRTAKETVRSTAQSGAYGVVTAGVRSRLPEGDLTPAGSTNQHYFLPYGR